MNYRTLLYIAHASYWIFLAGLLSCSLYGILYFYTISDFNGFLDFRSSQATLIATHVFVKLGGKLILLSIGLWLTFWLMFLIGSIICPRLKHNLSLHMLAFWKIPTMFFTRPSVEHLNEESCSIKIPLNRRTRNHVKSMYFGVLAVGADLAGGLMAMHQITLSKKRVSLVFKDCVADFHKRAEGDVIFTCQDGAMISQQVQETINTGERVNIPVTIIATVPDKMGDEPVASFKLTLSLKCKN